MQGDYALDVDPVLRRATHIVTALSFPDETMGWPSSESKKVRRSTPLVCTTHSCARSWCTKSAAQGIRSWHLRIRK